MSGTPPIFLVNTTRPIAISHRIVDDALAPEGMRVLETLVDGHCVCRAVVPTKGDDAFAPLYEAPRTLCFRARRKDDGAVQGEVLLMASRRDATRVREHLSLEHEPWRASVPSYESGLDEANGDEQVPVFVGVLVRLPHAIKHKDDWRKDATDLFARALAGRTVRVVEQALQGL